MILGDDRLRQIMSLYGYRYESCLNRQSGYRNVSHSIATDRGDRNLILYKDEAGIEGLIRRVNEVSIFLQQRDMPVRYSLDARILQLTKP